MGHTEAVRYNHQALVDAPVDGVALALADLDTYPRWNELVSEASSVPAVDDDLGPAWETTLRAQVGPFARSKRLRFVRTVDELGPDGAFQSRFERKEVDNRDHAVWVMATDARADERGRTRVSMELSYEGALWVPSLGGVLSGAIERSSRRLAEHVRSA